MTDQPPRSGTGGYFDDFFTSDDTDESEAWLAAGFGNLQLDRFFAHLDEHRIGDERFLVNRTHNDGTYRLDADLGLVVIGTATGRFDWQIERDAGTLAAEPALFQPEHPYTAIASDVEVSVVGLEPAALQRTARLLYGQDDLRVRFDGVRPVSPAAAARWLAVQQHVQSLAETGTLQNDLVRASTYRGLATAALECFRLIGDRRQLHASAERRLRLYRAAAEYLTAFASLPISSHDVAAAAGASVPELEQAFRAHAPDGSGPTAFLRQVRLAAALRDLQAADPTLGDTVREIALRWGFPSPGRFAAHFRQRYGTTSKHVLDR